MTQPTSQELAIIDALRRGDGRVLGRTELARLVGIAPSQGRRIDVLLVGVRRILGPEAVVNVRNRGWRFVDGHATALVDAAGPTTETPPTSS
jgi:DNA-binding response OmpR family regulator